ncbi:hypothetical protein fh0823_01840 [Francisella halioticida]|nr:hypothetical protein [Francisella halioticida]BCD90045.1 hypothetical protein fh0823_01840 [Francisella halioticida]
MNNVKPWQNKSIKSSSHATEIINTNLPNIKINTINLLGEGWDNITWIINDNLCFRFPKHVAASKLLLNEINVLSKCIKIENIKVLIYPVNLGQFTTSFSIIYSN